MYLTWPAASAAIAIAHRLTADNTNGTLNRVGESAAMSVRPVLQHREHKSFDSPLHEPCVGWRTLNETHCNACGNAQRRIA
jgi:hypothetical protein